MEAVQDTAEPGTDSQLTLRSRLGAITLVLLCAVQFLDIVDAAIVNVALPSIQHSLGFSQQNLQWVASGYILTYGGFLLLGGRLGDLLGRRRMLLIGLTVFALTSLTAGLANSDWLLIGSRLVQGIGAALIAPAALSELTTSFQGGKDRNTALGAWGAISGIAAAAGVFLGGAISQGPGWRWVFFVNPPICVLVAAGAVALLARDHGARRSAGSFDLQGAILVTGGALLLVYSLIRAPVVGWAPLQTILTLAGSAALLAVFAFNESRSPNPLVPLSMLRLKGLLAADGSYTADLLPGFLVMSLGAGSVFVSIAAAANAGVPPDKAGLAAGLLNSSQQVGSALGLAILSAVAITRTNTLLTQGATQVAAADAGYHRALLLGSILMATAALLALRIANTRQAAPLVMINTGTPPEPEGTSTT